MQKSALAAAVAKLRLQLERLRAFHPKTDELRGFRSHTVAVK